MIRVAPDWFAETSLWRRVISAGDPSASNALDLELAIQCTPYFDWIEKNQPPNPVKGNESFQLQLFELSEAWTLLRIRPDLSHTSVSAEQFGSLLAGVRRCIRAHIGPDFAPARRR